MIRIHAASALGLALAAGSLARAQPVPESMPQSMPGSPGGTVPADVAPAGTLPPSTPTVVDNTLPPPPPGVANKTYPVCRGGMTDNCQNPGEGGAPGRSRASDVKRRP